MIAYRAMLDVPRELVREVAKPMRAERRARGTRAGSRALTCWYQALLVLVWFRNPGDVAVVGAGFGVPRATAYRYRDEVINVLAEQAPDLHRRSSRSPNRAGHTSCSTARSSAPTAVHRPRPA